MSKVGLEMFMKWGAMEYIVHDSIHSEYILQRQGTLFDSLTPFNLVLSLSGLKRGEGLKLLLPHQNLILCYYSSDTLILHLKKVNRKTAT